MSEPRVKKFELVRGPIADETASAIVVPVAKGVRRLPTNLGPAAGGEGGAASALLASGDFRGELGETGIAYGGAGAKSGAERIILLGLGVPADLTRERIRSAVASVVRRGRDLGLARLVLPLPLEGGAGLSPAAQLELAVEAALSGSYQYLAGRTTDLDQIRSLGSLAFALPSDVDPAQAERALARGKARGEAVNFVRDLAHAPGNILTPTRLAEYAAQIAKESNLKLTVFEREQCAEMGMGLFCSVAQGSPVPPKFIVLEYDCGRADAPRIGLIGKGLTFDSGGISIKPAPKMEEMKMDMCGAGAVLGCMKALRAHDVSVHVVAAIAAAENMPGGRATKPGDVFKSYQGKTVEVQNTDAEGRLVLADALTYVARNYKPNAMVDLATLTGAVLIALGHYGAAVLSPDDALVERIRGAADSSGDRVWRLPLWEEYPEHLKSDCADLKNIADGHAGAGTIAGGTFLHQFVEGVPWAHLDIAGTAWWNEKDRPHLPKGASGYGVRLLLDLLESYGR